MANANYSVGDTGAIIYLGEEPVAASIPIRPDWEYTLMLKGTEWALQLQLQGVRFSHVLFVQYLGDGRWEKKAQMDARGEYVWMI